MRASEIVGLFLMLQDSPEKVALLLFFIILALLIPAFLGVSCIIYHTHPKEPPKEHEYNKKARELAELWRIHTARVKAQPEDAEALEQIYKQARQEIIERQKPEEPKPVRSSSYV